MLNRVAFVTNCTTLSSKRTHPEFLRTIMTAFEKGDKVEWNWGGGTASGSVTEIHTKEVEITTKGTTVKRNGSEENPAYIIEQDDGTKVLKSESELN